MVPLHRIASKPAALIAAISCQIRVRDSALYKFLYATAVGARAIQRSA
jgi:hypothetical protein